MDDAVELIDEDEIVEFIATQYVVPIIVDTSSYGEIFVEFSEKVREIPYE